MGQPMHGMRMDADPAQGAAGCSGQGSNSHLADQDQVTPVLIHCQVSILFCAASGSCVVRPEDPPSHRKLVWSNQNSIACQHT